uniref:Stabilin 2 n=1 Tax=Dicentrarchus labrax TaxID=13489 RepID=A0A8P4K5U1_DICLA
CVPECPESADRPCNNRGVCSDGLGGNGTCSCQVGFAGTACEDCASDRYGPTCSSVCSCVHGICGSGLKGSGSCLCFSGYTGPNCDQELPECVALSCQQNSRCIEEALTGKFVCQCLLGYQRSGAQCVSINPCLQRICHAQASCVHTGPNQHLCACNEGYSGDGRVCMAVDPCQNKRGGCAAESTRCVYDGPGKSHCECLPGFDLLSNGSCSLIDSCRPDSCHKNANCTMLSPGRIKSKADLASVLDLPGPITVFAPSSSAFDSMTEGHLQYLSSSKVRTKLNRSQLGQILVNEAAVLEAAVEAKNGRLYVLDGVLTPPSIQPVLPHRCDINETKIFEVSFYSSGCHGSFTRGCVFNMDLLDISLPVKGCAPLCSTNVTTPTCCKGFYGPDCSPCPGGYQTPCSGHGQCLEGIGGNGSCICESKFRGSRCQYCSSSDRYGPNCDRTCPCIHGQCDNRPDSDGRCKVGSCLSGFTGPFCERRTAVCGIQVQFCHAHADLCSVFRCVCKPGYQGDGITCVESDPCALPQRGGCSVNAKCIKTGPGSHSCQCLTGWREDGDECQPINNCDGPDRGGCHPNGTCIYIGPGQSDCMCKSGYKGNGQDCEAVNQCVTAAGTCHYLVSTIHITGSSWTLVDQNITLLVPSSAAIAKMSSEDINFWTTKGNLPSLVRSFKQTFGSETLIIFQLTAVGGATITTPNLAATNGLIHIIDKVLVPERKLSEGLLATLALTPDFSLFRSYLIDYNLMDEIEQMEEFTVFAPTNAAIADYLRTIDVNTTRYHVVASERLLETDLQSGGYKKTLLGFSFQLGIYPRDGKVIQSIINITIMRRRRALNVFSVQVLRCCGGFFGEHCELCPGPKDQPCFNNGVCSDGTNGTGVCQCNQGFSGTACETCESNKYGVHCDQGCGCKNGRCNDGLAGNGACECDVGWRGVLYFLLMKCLVCSDSCVIAPPLSRCICAFGFEGNGSFCRVKDPCLELNGGCNPNAVCKRTRPGRRECVCDRGYSGDGIVCVEINPCRERNGGCHVNADCIHVGPNKSSCACKFGYLGNGQNCEMIDYCQKNNGGCPVKSRCNMTSPGFRKCWCPKDHVGDGFTCRGNMAQVSAVLMYVCMFQDTGVMDLVNDAINEPVTIFMPSDAAMASLPQEQKDFLFHRDNRPQLEEYLKYHILQAQKVRKVTNNVNIFPASLIHLDSVRTLQGSPLSFTCGGLDDICRIVQRHLIFNGGIAYGINCLLTPPSLGGRCDEQTTFELQVNLPFKDCLLNPIFRRRSGDFISLFLSLPDVCIVKFWRSKCCHGYYGRDCLVCPGGVSSPCSNRGKCDDGQLGNGTCTCDVGFGGVACELCSDGFYGPTCKACNCSEHGSCDAGRRGTGSCFCEDGWTGERCETPQAEIFQCSPPCSPKAVCRENSTCMCRPFYEGDGFTCTVMDMCQIWNGGCAKGAKCSQTGEKVSCTCPKGHTGDGFNCQPIDRCSFADNGGCHEHATCTPTGKSRCTCKDNYIGDGVTCEVKQLPISRCLQDNGQCHQDAKCTDLHFEDTTFGVFHFRSYKGQYKLNYTEAQKACSALGATLATYNQLSYAQQGGLNLCAAGWLDKARVAYPTTYSNPNCGFGHVGIVDYGTRKDLGETWDTFCYRMKEVKCECKPGYVGDGFSCTGNLLQVLESTPNFSNFLTVSPTVVCCHKSNSSRYINNRFITESDILASNGIIHVLQGPLKAQPPRHEVSDVITTEFTKYTFKKRLTAKTGIACFSVVGSSDARGS